MMVCRNELLTWLDGSEQQEGRDRALPTYPGYFPAASQQVSGLTRTLFISRERNLLLAPARDVGRL